MLGNSVHGPRAISFLFLQPIVSSSLTDISYPDLDKALPAMPRVADGIVPLIQNALLAPAPAITQSYTVRSPQLGDMAYRQKGLTHISALLKHCACACLYAVPCGIT